MSVSSYQNVNISAVNNFGDMLNLFNQSGAGYLFLGIDFMVFFILFLTMSSAFTWDVALFASSFIGFVIGILFAYMGVMSWTWLSFFVGAIIFAILYKVYHRNG